MSDNTEDNLDIDSLQTELNSKNELISALTERLESTVEQLDRLKRSGVKPGANEGPGRPIFGLTQQVEQALEAFDELDPEEHFTRIESGIERILELMSNGNLVVNSGQQEQAKGEEDDEDEIPSAFAPEEEEDDFWAATKARLMGGEESESSSSPSQSETQSASTEPVAKPESVNLDAGKSEQFNTSVEYSDSKEEIPLADMPAPLEEFDDPVVLLEAVTDRDSYIIYLISRLRKAEAAAYPPVDWQELREAPAGLTAKLVDLHDQLEDQLRQAELAVSLERAMLTRERAKLTQVKQHLEKEIRRMGGGAQLGGPEGKENRDRLGKFLSLALKPGDDD